MEDLENRVIQLEQQFKDFEKYQGGITLDFQRCTDQIRDDFTSRVKDLTIFFEKQTALITLGFEDYKKENRKIMLGLMVTVMGFIIAAIVKGFLP